MKSAVFIEMQIHFKIVKKSVVLLKNKKILSLFKLRKNILFVSFSNKHDHIIPKDHTKHVNF